MKILKESTLYKKNIGYVDYDLNPNSSVVVIREKPPTTFNVCKYTHIKEDMFPILRGNFENVKIAAIEIQANGLKV